MKKKIERQSEWHLLAVHHHLNAFELRFLTRPNPTIDLTTLQDFMASPSGDVDSILDVPVPSMRQQLQILLRI